MGESRRAAFEQGIRRYIDFYLAHMHAEEEVILPSAQKHLSAADWAELDAAFAVNRDPLSGRDGADPAFEKLFTRIVSHAPPPIGVGR